MLDNEINSIILKIYDEQKKTSSKIDNMEKLINTKFREIQEQIRELQIRIGNLEKRVGSLEEKVSSLEKRVTSLEEKVTSLEKRVNNLEEKVNCLQEQVNSMQIQVNGIETKEIPSIKDELRKISKTVARIEQEHGEKLQILFDAVTGSNQKSKELEKRIEKDEKIINRHSNEIYYLKEKVQNA